MKGLLKLKNGDKGQSMVEFAIVLPLLLFVILAIIQGSMYFSAKTTLSNEAREAVRLVALRNDSDSNIETRIKIKIAENPFLSENKKVTVSIDPSVDSRQSLKPVTVSIKIEGLKLTLLNWEVKETFASATMMLEPTATESGGTGTESNFTDRVKEFETLYTRLAINSPASATGISDYKEWGRVNESDFLRASELYSNEITSNVKGFESSTWERIKENYNTYLRSK